MRPDYCCGVDRKGHCRSIPKLGKIHSDGVCDVCEAHQGFGLPIINECPSVGLGDTIHKILKKLGIGRIIRGKGCGCERRRSWLNRVFSYRSQ